jgi:nucleoside-diphosphate-sugar epimerase
VKALAADTVLLAGASGLVGGQLARGLAMPGRRLLMPLRRPQARLLALAGAEALPWPLAEPLPRIELAISALGTTIAAAGSRDAFRAVDFDAVLAFAQAARRAGARRFGLVSAVGAAPQSPVFYNRVKGEAEAAIAELGFEQLVIVQPSLLLGDREALGQAHRPGEAIAQRLAPWLAPLTPARFRPVAAEQVAGALLKGLAERGRGLHRLDNAALFQAATAAR